MLIPISTDAPLYHFPAGTIGLIAVNVVCFFIAGHDPDTWILHYGHWNPIEWLISIFAHADFLHLLGNMIFLWAFGLIVEGKLGWLRFLALYLAIGVGQSAIEQTLMLSRSGSAVLESELGIGSPDELREQIAAEDPDLSPAGIEAELQSITERLQGGSCGASAAIFGLLAICLVWAPKNEFQVIMFILYRAILFDITIMWYAIWYIGWEIFLFVISGMQAGSAFLHLMGAGMGFVAGVILLKKNWVDCENWDLFRVLSGTYGRHADPLTAVGSHADPRLMFGRDDVSVNADALTKKKEKPPVDRLQRIQKSIDSGDFITASSQMLDLRLVDSRSRLDEGHLRRLALGLMRVNAVEDAEGYLEEYLTRFPETSSWAYVRMAQLQLVHRRRPAMALELLRKVKRSELPPELLEIAGKISANAKKLIKAGVQDAEPEW